MITAPTETPSPAKPCECPEPDGHCDACEEEHGHTCIVCGYDFCGLCWETAAHNDDCATPSLTTEQARDLATRWADWKAWADVRGGLGQHDAEYEGPWDPHGEEGSERDRLETWVRARMVAHLEGWQDSHETAAAYLAAFPEARCDVAGELADDLSWDHEGPDEDTPAWALCVAAGWP